MQNIQNILDAPIEIKSPDLGNSSNSNQQQHRLKELSYSSLGTKHKCPYKFLLEKTLPSAQRIRTTSVTFAYGHAVGEGIQQSLLGKSRDQILWEMFKIWDYDLLEVLKPAKKSFPHAVLAVDKFQEFLTYSDLAEYEVATIGGKPATELSFKITLLDGYVYRGYIDVVLRHKHTGKLLVLEIKTSGASWLHEAMYKNSAQALGYTIVLDTLDSEEACKDSESPEIEFEVRYLVYKTKAMEYEQFSFFKLFEDKVLWIKDILDDCASLTAMTKEGHFPRRGEFCFDFFKPCDYIDMCGLKPEVLKLNYEAKSSDVEDYTLNINLTDILDSMEESQKSFVNSQSPQPTQEETIICQD